MSVSVSMSSRTVPLSTNGSQPPRHVSRSSGGTSTTASCLCVRKRYLSSGPVSWVVHTRHRTPSTSSAFLVACRVLASVSSWNRLTLGTVLPLPNEPVSCRLLCVCWPSVLLPVGADAGTAGGGAMIRTCLGPRAAVDDSATTPSTREAPLSVVGLMCMSQVVFDRSMSRWAAGCWFSCSVHVWLSVCLVMYAMGMSVCAMGRGGMGVLSPWLWAWVLSPHRPPLVASYTSTLTHRSWGGWVYRNTNASGHSTSGAFH
mmetsp:Transcript_8038/g.19789  ORF Transcript_8038/g.19789 Transcript_8038/m.19789 type:complete len:258 (+) Transcript_8038:395-1168(+)